MKVGQLMLFQNHPNLPQSDFDMYQNELDIALMSEPLGLDSIWAVEHHFTDYTLCPNIPQFLAFMAGQTKRIKLGTAAIILPWHKDPIRVATDIAMLDNLSKGRVLLGMGRGLERLAQRADGVTRRLARVHPGVVLRQHAQRPAPLLADGPERGADDLVAPQRRGPQLVLRMLEHLGLERIDLEQRHADQVHIAASVGSISQRLVVATALIRPLGLADEIEHRAVDVILVARSSSRRAGGHVRHDDVLSVDDSRAPLTPRNVAG